MDTVRWVLFIHNRLIRTSRVVLLPTASSSHSDRCPSKRCFPNRFHSGLPKFSNSLRCSASRLRRMVNSLPIESFLPVLKFQNSKPSKLSSAPNKPAKCQTSDRFLAQFHSSKFKAE